MHSFLSLVHSIAQRIAETESKRARLAAFVREIASETNLTTKVPPSPLEDIKIAAVDGGIVKKSLHGMDCMLVRAAAVCFQYKDGKVAKVQYFPSRNPTPRPEIYEALSELDWNHFSSLNRLREEVSTAVQCLDSLQPDILLMDGMILPHYLDKPSRSSPLYNSYESLLQLYNSLFKKVLQKKICLAGVIEDSRNTIFCEYLEKHVLSRITHSIVPEMTSLLRNTRDTNLLSLILKKGERSCSFQSAPVVPEMTIPAVTTFYLKTASYDRPLKIDYLSDTQDIDTLSSILLAISGHHSSYGIPTPIIEADQVAKLSENEIEALYSNIISLTGRLSSTMKLRREQRPF